MKNIAKVLFSNPKKKYFQEKFSFYKNDIENTWKTLKDVIVKTKINENHLPKKIALENKEITKTVAEKFIEFYVNVGPNLPSKIPQNNDYKSYVPDITTLFDEQDLTEQELEEAVASLKPNKSRGCDSIHINVIKAIYEELKRPLFYIFDQSLKSGIFPDKLKIQKFSRFINQEKSMYYQIIDRYLFFRVFQKY